MIKEPLYVVHLKRRKQKYACHLKRDKLRLTREKFNHRPHFNEADTTEYRHLN